MRFNCSSLKVPSSAKVIFSVYFSITSASLEKSSGLLAAGSGFRAADGAVCAMEGKAEHATARHDAKIRRFRTIGTASPGTVAIAEYRISGRSIAAIQRQLL